MSFEVTVIAALCALAIATAADASDKTGIELLGQPCRARNVLSHCVVKDRADGRERFALANMNEDTGAEIIYIDYENDSARVFRAPSGAGSWGLMEVAGDRLVMPMFYDGTTAIFDLKKMAFIRSIPFPGETYVWTCAVGGDGRVYGGTYAGGKLGAIDLNTYQLEDLGAPSPPNMYLRAVAALPDGRIVCNFITQKPGNLVYDPATKKFGPTPEGIGMGFTWQDYYIMGSTFYGKDLKPVAAPFPAPPADKGAWYVHQGMSRPDTLYIVQGTTVYRWNKGDKDLTFVADVDLRGGNLCHSTADGKLLGLRGQDYFVVSPGDTSITVKPIPGESGARPTHFLKVDADGRLWGGPTFGQTLFWLDPKTKTSVNTGCVSNNGGEVYDVAFYRGRVYAAAYAGGEIICYDPGKPWNQIDGKNPKIMAEITTRGYIRPTGGIMVGPEGKLYSGWQAKYGTYGGAVAITDPNTGDTDLIENPLGEQAIQGVVVSDDYIFVGTHLGGNGLANKTGEWARFGVLDIRSRKVIFQQEIENMRAIAPLAYDPKNNRAVVSIGGQLNFFDVKTQKLAPLDVPACRGWSNPGDGKLYYGSGNAIQVLDIATGKATQLLDAGKKVQSVAADWRGNVYFSSGIDVYAVKR